MWCHFVWWMFITKELAILILSSLQNVAIPFPTTQRHFPQDSNLDSHYRKKLQPHTSFSSKPLLFYSPYILPSVACLTLPYFPHYLINGMIFGKQLFNIKCVFWFSLRLVSEIFLILRRIQR
jgi:hypothetical protein